MQSKRMLAASSLMVCRPLPFLAHLQDSRWWMDGASAACVPAQGACAERPSGTGLHCRRRVGPRRWRDATGAPPSACITCVVALTRMSVVQQRVLQLSPTPVAVPELSAILEKSLSLY
jgi:hypothetical protein